LGRTFLWQERINGRDESQFGSSSSSYSLLPPSANYICLSLNFREKNKKERKKIEDQERDIHKLEKEGERRGFKSALISSLNHHDTDRID